MIDSLTLRTLRCDFVRNSTIGNRLILQDSYRAEVACFLAGFHFSTALFNRSTVSMGSWLVFSDSPFLEFFNSSGIKLLGSETLVRSSALGVDSWGHRSEWVNLDPVLPVYSGQVIGLYAFASTLNTQRNFSTVTLALLPTE